jgi:Domain of unknown function (DUF222)
MRRGPAPAGPGRDGDPAREPAHTPDPMTGEDWLAWCDSQVDQDEPPDPDEEEPDPDGLPGPWEYDLDAIVADCRRITAEEAAACARAARLGLAGGQPIGLARRGPGQPGSARRAPGEFLSRAAGFAAGMLLDVMPGCNALAGFAAEAAGEDDRYEGACDDEVVGAIAAWDRIEAHAAARKHAAVAEFIRRRPEPGGALEGAAQMPAVWDEFTVTEVAAVLGESRGTAGDLLDLAHDLEVKLPGTRVAFRDGTLRASKVEIIARAAAVLDPAEARKAEAMVLDRAGRLTPGGLRAAIAHAVMEVAPEKARKRREQAAKDARVLRWEEDSGNAALAGRELPPAEALAADQRITAWARQLKKAGLDGSMHELRARAYLDILLDKDSRPAQQVGGGDAAGRDGTGPDGTGSGGPDGPPAGGSGPDAPAGPGRPPGTGALPAGFAGRVNLTVPLATLLDLAGRPGEIPGIGPVDPWLARDLANAAAGHPKTTWCVTVTDEQGHAIGHGCARPEPKSHRKERAERRKPGPPDGRDPPRRTSGTPGPEFSFTACGQHGPPGGYGTWRLRTLGEGPDLIVALDPITTGDCDHRFEAKGHDPGVKLRHLSQIRYATCTGLVCRRPSTQSDFEHNIPYEAGGRTCLCNGGPKCRRDHRLKQHPRWHVDQLPDGTFRWTTPTGRQYTTEPTRYPT